MCIWSQRLVHKIREFLVTVDHLVDTPLAVQLLFLGWLYKYEARVEFGQITYSEVLRVGNSPLLESNGVKRPRLILYLQ